MTTRQRGFVAYAAACWLALSPAAAERPWESRMQAFEAEDAGGTTPGGVVFVGSSSIRLWDLEKWFGPGGKAPLAGPVLNRGFGGSQLEHSIAQIELLVLKHEPRQVVLYAGDNDIAAGKSAERVADDFRLFVERLQKRLPETRLAYIAIKPSLKRWEMRDEMEAANASIRLQCEGDDRLAFIDIWKPMLSPDGTPRAELFVDDGLHLSDAGYALWTRLVAAQIR